MQACINLVGDSILDNVYWVKKPSESVEKKLTTLCGNQYKITNHAYDGFTTESLLQGDIVGRVLPDQAAYLKARLNVDVTSSTSPILSKPIEELKKETASSGVSHYVPLSIGGNDFRVKLANPWQLVSSISDIQKRYLQIVKQIKESGTNVYPILVFLYRTDSKNDNNYQIYSKFKKLGQIAFRVQIASALVLLVGICLLAVQSTPYLGIASVILGTIGLYGSCKVIPITTIRKLYSKNKKEAIEMIVFKHLLRSFYQPILKQAKKDRIPILDLANTFDPSKSLYECSIEPNEAGSTLIAEGIQHIVTKHDFKGKSVIYARPGSASSYAGKENANPSNWNVD